MNGILSDPRLLTNGVMSRFTPYMFYPLLRTFARE
jgi:hypothetical protein